jgi:sugar lactone lactonase YvrE
MPNGIAVDLRNESGFPDGLADCGDGSAIVAFYNPDRGGHGLARRYRLDTGAPVEEWVMPGSPRVTCPLLFDVQNRTVVIFTTAVEGMSDEMRKQSPNAGCLFMAEPAVKAFPTADVVRL